MHPRTLWVGKLTWPSHPLQSWSTEHVRTCWNRQLTTVLRRLRGRETHPLPSVRPRVGSRQASDWALHGWAAHASCRGTPEELPAAGVHEAVCSHSCGAHFLPVTLQCRGATPVPCVLSVCALVFGFRWRDLAVLGWPRQMC